MKGLASGIKVGLITLVVVVVGFWLWKSVGERVAGGSGYTLWAKFRDAQGLASKSRVVIAGLNVGEIKERRLEGRFARVTVRIGRDNAIWSNAIIFKKSSSLLGEYYLEIDPGSAKTVNDDGTVVDNRLLGPGDEIPTVVEAATTDELFRSVSQTLPKVNNSLDEVSGLVRDVRKLVNGQITRMADNLDKTIADNAATVTSILTRADRSLANIETILADVRKVTGSADDRVDRILDNVEAATVEAKNLMVEARKELADTGGAVREKLDRLDATLANIEETTRSAKSVAQKIDEDRGTLGRLVNDSTIADNVADITTSAKGFTDSLFGLQTVVGLRGEYNFIGRNYRSYVSLEARTRTDKFYLVELVADPKGELDEDFTYDEATGTFNRQFTFDNGFRFTFQFGKRWNWLGLRLGIKDSTGGAGLDFHFLDDKLKMSLDVFDLTYYELPRVKFWAAYEVLRYFYVYAGADDILHASESKPITGDFITGEEYRQWTFGLDFFAGTMLQFNDRDLSALLFIGGGALGGLGSN
jgi:phospholipid/cholesterol/gamma-HCH transport system substrate-binding protein